MIGFGQDAEEYFNLAIKFRAEGKYKLALDKYSKCIELKNDFANDDGDNAYNQRGITYYLMSEYENAIVDFTKAIDVNPNKSIFYQNRASSFGELNNTENAIDDYKKAIEINPNNATAYNNLGVTYHELKMFKEAIENYYLAYNIDPNLVNLSTNIKTTLNLWEKSCKNPSKPRKYNSRQSQEEFEETDKYLTYLTELDNWKKCRTSINNTQLYSRKMQLDKESGKVIIDNITKAEGISKDELYSNAKVWLASFFNSTPDVIKLDDKDNGIIISKGLFTFEWNGGLLNMDYISNCYFTLKIYCKEGRFRVIWTDFEFDIMRELYKVSADERLLNPYKLEGSNNINTVDGFVPDGTWSSQKESVLRSIDSFNYSITKALTQKRESLGDDW